MKPRNAFPHVLAAFYGTPWAILPDKFREIEAVLLRRIASGPFALATPEQTAGARRELKEAWAERRGDPAAFDPSTDPGAASGGPGYRLVGTAAVVPVHGAIVPRPSLFTEYSGGTSAEQIGRAADAAAADPKAEAIVLDFDSPGGSVFGIADAGAKILAARKAKPVYAVANHIAASGAYWLATQADTVAVTNGGWVGSVGVIWPRVDESKKDALAGVETTYVTAGENKTDGYGPTSPAELVRMQEMVDAYYAQFVSAVAKGRGVSAAKVEKDFGQGAVKLPAGAIEARMADRVATLEQIVAEVNKARTDRTKRKVAADLARAGLPTA